MKAAAVAGWGLVDERYEKQKISAIYRVNH